MHADMGGRIDGFRYLLLACGHVGWVEAREVRARRRRSGARCRWCEIRVGVGERSRVGEVGQEGHPVMSLLFALVIVRSRLVDGTLGWTLPVDALTSLHRPMGDALSPQASAVSAVWG